MADNLVNVNAKQYPHAVSNVSSRVAVGTTGQDGTIMIDNTFTAAVDCYVKSGDANVVATTADMHIAVNEKAPYEIDPAHTHMASITAAGATTLRYSRGSGQ